MARGKFGLGNKKSVVLCTYGAYKAGVFTAIQNVVSGSPIKTEASAVLTNVENDPVGTLGPVGVGYWFWGKPWRGKL